MIFQDDRTEAERGELTELVGGRDSFMSGWGKASGGSSFAFWACAPEHLVDVETWVDSRDDITRCDLAELLAGERHEHEHCHIYAVRETHHCITDGPHQMPPGGGQ